ncbi:MAG TPA: D-alanine--D-alanine ligase [Arenimonas sp.]|nr:D-alanine--D-alanine ligase [Arenimonas sp.]HPW32120.1 D-alanine--D-alanine ligase [Arenimonas sp.]
MKRITDAKEFGRVAVLMGGTSSEREVSLNSGANVLAALLARGVDAQPMDGIPALVEALHQKKFDRVFNILHGTKGGGEDGILQGLCEAMNIPYTGSDVLGSALSMDKIRTKQVWLSLGLPTPRYVRLSVGDDVHAAAKSLGLPVIIKPSCEGSSVGVSRVFNDADLDAAVELAARYPGEMLMEQLIEGGEYTIGVLEGKALASIHIVPAGEYYDYHSKYISDETQYICPGLPDAEEKVVQQLAEKAFAGVGCRGWARIDFMRDKNGGIFLLEANTAPGMTSHSLMPKSAKAFGIDFESLCWRILESSFA